MKKEIKKTKKSLDKLNNKLIINSNLENTQNKVEKLSGEIFSILSRKTGHKKNKTTFGQKTSDIMSKWAGSWTFIIIFLAFIVFWMYINTYIWIGYLNGNPFDPYPFILLNLVLSCVAAIQAPIILMSQNRAAQRDRIRAEYDYKVNRKAEKEIREIKKQLDNISRKIR